MDYENENKNNNSQASQPTGDDNHTEQEQQSRIEGMNPNMEQPAWQRQESSYHGVFQKDEHKTTPKQDYHAERQKSADEPFQQQHSQQGFSHSSCNATFHAPQQPKERKGTTGKRVVIGLCSAAAACLLFAGGILAANVFAGDDQNTYGGAPHVSGNLPTVNISETPNYDPQNYDVVNGLAGEEIYKKVNPSIVCVISSSLTSDKGGTGSGIIMSTDGYIITNNHVVCDETTGARMQSITVQFADGSQMPAMIIGTDERTDLAVIKVESDKQLVAAEFGDSDQLQPGEYAYAIGSPGGVQLANTITGGRISAINRDITISDRVMTLIQTDASINPGNSGGALINKYGQVVGITSAKLGISYYEGLGFAIPMNTAKEIIDELIQNGFIAGRPAIGINRATNISEQRAKYNNVPQGVYVQSVDSRAKAASEGLQAGDIITAVNGETITTMDQINEIKQDMKAGDQMTLKVYRMSTGKMIDLKITLTDEHDLEDDDTQQTQQQTQRIPQQGDGGYSQYDHSPFDYFFNW